MRPLRFTTRSVVRAVAIFGATLAILAVVNSASRVIGWTIAASVVAALLAPAVSALERRMPRPAAFIVVVVGVVSVVAFVLYSLVDDFQQEARRLERAAPAAARSIERSERLGEVARDFGLAERVESLVSGLPASLTGGTGADAVRANATRGIAFLASGVLMLFLVSHGPRLASAAIDALPADRRERWRTAIETGYAKAWRYVVATIAKAFGAGLLTWVVASVAGLPAPRLLALWAGAWDIVPYVGVVLGVLPLLLLSIGDSGDAFAEAGAILLIFAYYELGESLFVQPRIDRWSMHVGPSATVIPAMIGLEVYGIGGLFVAVALTVFAVAVLQQLPPRRAPADDIG